METREDNSTLDQSAIGFWSYVGSSTRADDLTDAFFSEFCVTAYTLDSYGDLEYKYIPKTIVSREVLDSSAWSIENDATYYWPLTTPLSFFAFYPSKVLPFVEIEDSDSDPYVPYINYTNDFFAQNQPDIIAACELNKVKSEAAITTDPVNLTFSHIMTKLNFSIKGQDDYLTYHVTEIKLNAHHKGEFYFDLGYDESSRTDIDSSTPSSAIGWWKVYDAGVETEPQTYDDYYNSTSSTSSSDVATDNREFVYFRNSDSPLEVGPETETGDLELTLGDSYSFMMIPQSLPSNAEISVTYYITYNSFTISNPITRTLSLDGVTWGMGNNLLYRLTLPTTGLEDIVVDVESIIDWNIEGEYNIYTGPVVVDGFVVNDYYDQATFDEEEDGLFFDIEVDPYDDSGDFNEADSGIVGDLIVDDYSDDDEYDESEGGVVGDVVVDPYDEDNDYDEGDSGIIGDLIVGDYANKDYFEETEGGVVGTIEVVGYTEEKDYDEGDSGIVGDLIVGDYTDKDYFEETEGGVVGTIEVVDYTEEKEYNEDDSGIVGDLEIGDYTDNDYFEETEGGVVGTIEVVDYTEEKDYDEDDSGIEDDLEIGDYTDNVTEDLKNPDDPDTDDTDTGTGTDTTETT